MVNFRNKTILIAVCLSVLAFGALIYTYTHLKAENEKLKASLLKQTQDTKQQANAYQDTLKHYHLLESINTMLLVRNNEGALELMSKINKNFTKTGFDTTLTYFVNSLKQDSTATDSLNQKILGLQRNIMLSNIALSRSRESIKTSKSSIDSLENQLFSSVLYANQQALLNNQLKEEVEKLKTSYGKLTFKTEDGKDVVYYGETLNNKADGYGIGVFDGKSIYQGEWKNGFRHGTGKYKWKNDDIYEGEYVYGKREGFGKYTFASGEKYEGNWKNDLRDGKGKLYDKQGNLIVEGKWIADKYDKTSNPKKESTMR